MGIFLSITNTSSELTKSQKLYRLTESNEFIIDPADFQSFIKAFRGLQHKKEDNQIQLRNLVHEWKSRLRNDQTTHEIRTHAYDLINTIENLHDEQDALLESENEKLELMLRECAKNTEGFHRISRDFDRIHLDNESEVMNADHGTTSDNLTKNDVFTDMHKEISKRQQYLQMFNNQSTMALKKALLDIEVCRKMVDYSKDFVDCHSDEEVSSSTDSEEDLFPHPV